MSDIVDINFNFTMIDKKITQRLNEYNISKENFCKGTEVESVVIKNGEKVINLINIGLILIDYRLNLINNEYMEDKVHHKQNLKSERLNLSKKTEWFYRLKKSIRKETESIQNGEFDTSDENDFE